MSSEAPITTGGSEQDGAAARALTALEGTWRVAPQHSTVGFRVKKMGMYHVKGRFRDFEGVVEFSATSARGEVAIEADSVDTRMPPRDAHLRSRDFLEVKTHPKIRVSAPSIEAGADGALRVQATCELHGSRGTVELTGHAHGGRGVTSSLVLHLTGTLDRHAFGIRARQPFEMVVGRDVLLDVELVLDRA